MKRSGQRVKNIAPDPLRITVAHSRVLLTVMLAVTGAQAVGTAAGSARTMLAGPLGARGVST